MLYQVVIKAIRLFLNLFIDFSVVNREKIPVQGPFIVTCNHSTGLDTVFLPLALYPQVIRFMVKQELMNNKLYGWYFRAIYCFPVNREKPGPSSIKIPVKLLREGKIVAIMPSGTRDKDVVLKQGAALIAIKSGAAIVPAVYVGAKTLKIKNIFKREKAQIIFGNPISAESYGDYSGHDKLAYVTDILEKEIDRLLNESETVLIAK